MRHLDEHLDDGLIHALLDGELSGDELAAARAHVLACDACSARVAEERLLAGEAERLIAELDQSSVPPADGAVPLPESPTVKGPPVVLIPDAGEEPNRWQRRKPPSRWIGIAAMLVVAAGAGLVALQSGPDDASFGTDAVVSDMELPAPEGRGFALTDSAAPAPTADSVAAAQSALDAAAGAGSAAPVSRTNETQGAPLAGVAPSDGGRQPPSEPRSATPDSRASEEAGRAREEPPARATELAQGTRSEERTAEPRVSQPESRAERDENVASVMQMRPGVTAGAAAPAAETRRRDSLRVPAAPTVATPAPRRAPLSLEEQSQISMRIGLDEAQRLLGSPMHVIDGLQPEFVGLVPGRLVRGANPNDYVVRVVYLDEQRRKIYLDQQRLDLTGRQLGLQRDTVPPEWVKGEVRLSLSGDISSDAARALARRVR